MKIGRHLILPVSVIVVLSLLYFYFLLRPPTSDLNLMMLLLSTTALISAVAGYAFHHMGWMKYSPAMVWTLLGGYLLSSILTFLNVWVTAQLMFADEHDLLLATVLLFFATGIAVVIGYFLSNALVQRVLTLKHMAQEVALGNLSIRVSIPGRDELSELASTFNKMTEQLETAENKKREVEILRRDLIAWISHDLQTPLTSIRAMIEALDDGIVEDQQTATRYLNAIQREVDALSSLIDDLFQMAQLDAGGLKLILEKNSLNDLISDTLESFSEIATQNQVKLVGSVDPSVDPVHFDAQQLGRVFNNLIGNALRHTPPNGRVEINAQRKPDSIKITIKDTGEGISEQDLPFVFDRFYRGEKSRSRATGGAGLGLAISKSIIEAHGGKIKVNSNLAQGTEFILTLPV